MLAGDVWFQQLYLLKSWKFEVEADQYALVVKEKKCGIAKMFNEF